MVLARILTAVLGVPAIIIFIKAGGTAFFFLVLAISLLGLGEYYRLTHAPRGFRVWGYTAGVLLLVGAWQEAGCLGDIAVFLLLALLIMMVGAFPHFTFEQAGSALLGVLYIPFLFSYLLKLHALAGGEGYTLLTFILTWVSDSLAFLVGSRWGRHRLAVRLSPKKTWEGAVAGWLGCILVLLFVHTWFGLGLWQALVLGTVVGLAAEVGDLVESALKRQAQVKDSGNILPGHGGILDRFDALLFVTPVMYAARFWLWS